MKIKRDNTFRRFADCMNYKYFTDVIDLTSESDEENLDDRNDRLSVMRQIGSTRIKHHEIKWTEKDDQELVSLALFEIKNTNNNLRIMKTYKEMINKGKYLLKDIDSPRKLLQRLKILSHPKKLQYLQKLCARAVGRDPHNAAYQLRVSVLECNEIERWNLTYGVNFVDEPPGHAYNKIKYLERSQTFSNIVTRVKRSS